MRESGLQNTDVARRLGLSEAVVRRQNALAVLGKRIVVSFEDAA